MATTTGFALHRTVNPPDSTPAVCRDGPESQTGPSQLFHPTAALTKLHPKVPFGGWGHFLTPAAFINSRFAALAA